MTQRTRWFDPLGEPRPFATRQGTPPPVGEALRALAEREPRLARMEGGCASEGVVEVLIEPVLPAPLLAIVGESPAARTLGALARYEAETATQTDKEGAK